MVTSSIKIDIHLNKDKVPQKINWSASESTIEKMQDAKAMMVAFWDGAEKNALRIDLWTKEMMVDEMADFYYQTFLGMAESYNRATHDEILVNDIKTFAKSFYKKFKELQLKENKI